jgi:hypothetical protein
MPAKKTVLNDEQRAKNIREAAEKIGASNDPKVLDKALKRITPAPKGVQLKSQRTS